MLSMRKVVSLNVNMSSHHKLKRAFHFQNYGSKDNIEVPNIFTEGSAVVYSKHSQPPPQQPPEGTISSPGGGIGRGPREA